MSRERRIAEAMGEMSAPAHSVNALKAEAEGNFHDYKKSTEIWRQELKEKLDEKLKQLDSLISQATSASNCSVPSVISYIPEKL